MERRFPKDSRSIDEDYFLETITETSGTRGMKNLFTEISPTLIAQLESSRFQNEGGGGRGEEGRMSISTNVFESIENGNSKHGNNDFSVILIRDLTIMADR